MGSCCFFSADFNVFQNTPRLEAPLHISPVGSFERLYRINHSIPRGFPLCSLGISIIKNKCNQQTDRQLSFHAGPSHSLSLQNMKKGTRIDQHCLYISSSFVCFLRPQESKQARLRRCLAKMFRILFQSYNQKALNTAASYQTSSQ